MADATEAVKKVDEVPGAIESDKNHDVDSGSGSENGEKPVREKLKKTDLEEDTEANAASTAYANGAAAEGGSGKLKKKRSYKDLVVEDEAEPATPSEGSHTRKRTRETRGSTTKDGKTSLLHSEIAGEDEDETKHSDGESDKIIVTPPSSGDEAMAEAEGTGKVKKKRSSEEMLGSQEELLRSPKVAATDAERERRSSSAPLSDNESKLADDSSKDGQKSDPPRSVPKGEIKPTATQDTKIPATSGFANTSSTSPFATFASNQPSKGTSEELPQTSASAFAGSGFAAMANSSSPFGSLAKPQSTSVTTEEKPQTSSSAFAGSGFASMTGSASPFGGTASASKTTSFGSSPFASNSPASGFGSSKTFGSGFGSSFGGGAKLSSFATPVGDAKIGQTSSVKPFGAPEASDDEDDGEDKSDNEDGEEGDTNSSFGGPGAEGSSQFKIRNDQTTGEEGESTSFSTNVKVYQLVGGAWTERGSGPFRLNYKIANSDGEVDPESAFPRDFMDLQPGDGKVDARFIVRNAATHKVIVNARIFKEMTVGDLKGKEPTKKNEFFFSAATDTGIDSYLIRLGKKDSSNDLYDQVKKIQELL